MWNDAALLSVDFDEDAYLRHSLHLPSVESEQSRLNRCGEVVQREIRILISGNSDALLGQVDAASTAEKEVSAFRAVVGTLGGSMKRLKHTIADPHAAIEHKVTELKHTMSAIETLRLLQRFLGAIQKLPELVAADVARAARSLRDIEDILSTNQLQGIEAAERHFDVVTKLSAAIRSKAHEMLKTATAAQNQADVSAALQCFFSLGTLHKVMTNIIAEHKRELTKLIMKDLDAQGMTQRIEQRSGSSDTNGTRDVVFSTLDVVIGEAAHRFESVMLLWKILQKKKDPITHEPFMEAVKDGKLLLSELWSSLSQLLFEKLSKLYKRGNVFLMLVSEFPRYYGSLNRLVTASADVLAAIDDRDGGHRWLLGTIDEAEKRFIALSQEKHRDKVQQITVRLTTLIPTGGSEAICMDVAVDPARPQLPSTVTALDIKGLMKLLQQEIGAFRHDPHVLALVLKQSCASLSLLSQRFQEALSKVSVVSGGKAQCATEGTAGQIFQFCITNALSGMHSDLSNMLSALPSEDNDECAPLVAELKRTTKTFEAMGHALIIPYFTSATAVLSQAIEESIEDIGGDSALQRLTAKVGSVVSRFLLLLDRSSPGLEEEENRLVETLLKHTVSKVLLQRPLDVVSATHYCKCLAQIPQVVSTIPHLPTPSTNMWRNELKAFKGMLASSNDDSLVEAHVASVHTPLLLLHLVQRIPMSCFPSLSRVSSLGEQQLLATAIEAMQDGKGSTDGASGAKQRLLDWISKGFREYEASTLDVDESKKRRWHLEMFQTLRRTLNE